MAAGGSRASARSNVGDSSDTQVGFSSATSAMRRSGRARAQRAVAPDELDYEEVDEEGEDAEGDEDVYFDDYEDLSVLDSLPPLPGASSSASVPVASTSTAPAPARAQRQTEGSRYPSKRNATSTGRRKIQIAKIQDKTRRGVTFSKRKSGLFKKAHELSELTGCPVICCTLSETGVLYHFASGPSLDYLSTESGQDLLRGLLQGTENGGTMDSTPEASASSPQRRKRRRTSGSPQPYYQDDTTTLDHPADLSAGGYGSLSSFSALSQSAAAAAALAAAGDQPTSSSHATAAAAQTLPLSSSDILRQQSLAAVGNGTAPMAQSSTSFEDACEAADAWRAAHVRGFEEGSGASDGASTLPASTEQAMKSHLTSLALAYTRPSISTYTQAYMDYARKNVERWVGESVDAVAALSDFASACQSRRCHRPDQLAGAIKFYFQQHMRSQNRSDAFRRDARAHLEGMVAFLRDRTLVSEAQAGVLSSLLQTSVRATQSPTPQLQEPSSSIPDAPAGVEGRLTRAASEINKWQTATAPKYHHRLEMGPVACGTFDVYRVRRNYIVVREKELVEARAADSPLKIRIPHAAAAHFIIDDEIGARLRKVSGRSYWVPVGPVELQRHASVPEEDEESDIDPSQYRNELDRLRALPAQDEATSEAIQFNEEVLELLTRARSLLDEGDLSLDDDEL